MKRIAVLTAAGTMLVASCGGGGDSSVGNKASAVSTMSPAELTAAFKSRVGLEDEKVTLDCTDGLQNKVGAKGTCTARTQYGESKWDVTIVKAGETGATAPEFWPEGVDPSAGGTEGAEENDTPTTTVQAGKAFTYEDGTVTLTSTRCGVTTLKDAAMSNDGTVIDAKPDAGSAFCLIEGTVKNNSKKPLEGTPSFYGLVTADGTQYGELDSDPDFGDIEGVPQAGVMHKINPGGASKFVDVYQLPVGVKPVALLSLDPEQIGASDESSVRFELPTG